MKTQSLHLVCRFLELRTSLMGSFGINLQKISTFGNFKSKEDIIRGFGQWSLEEGSIHPHIWHKKKFELGILHSLYHGWSREPEKENSLAGA